MLFGCCRCFENKLQVVIIYMYMYFHFQGLDPKDKKPWRDLANLSLTYKINHPREYLGYNPGNTPGTPLVHPRKYSGYTPGILEVYPGKQPKNIMYSRVFSQ